MCAECLPPLTEAVELYRDDFMAGFGLRDSAAFDDWQFFQSESLRRELAGALERLARGRGALGEWEAADRPRQAVAGPGRPARAGPQDAHGALRVVRPARRRPAPVQGVRKDPGPGARRSPARGDDPALQGYPGERSTTTTDPLRAQAICPARSREPLRPLVETSRNAARSPDNPLVGRDPEWEALLGSYGSIEEAGHVVVVEGEAGIGKTRLAEEFVAHVRARRRDRRHRALLRGREEPGLRAFRRRTLRRPRSAGHRSA